MLAELFSLFFTGKFQYSISALESCCWLTRVSGRHWSCEWADDRDRVCVCMEALQWKWESEQRFWWWENKERFLESKNWAGLCLGVQTTKQYKKLDFIIRQSSPKGAMAYTHDEYHSRALRLTENIWKNLLFAYTRRWIGSESLCCCSNIWWFHSWLAFVGKLKILQKKVTFITIFSE